MEHLPSALAPMGQYRNFILWTPVWNEQKQKHEKIPTSPLTGQTIGNNVTSHYVTFEEAQKAATKYNLQVGFVLTENTPFFFLDIDKCREGEGWSKLANDLCERLSGAAVEVSHSQNGLHIFGRGSVQDHACKNIQLDLELYTEGRFVALTGINTAGDANTDHTEEINKIVDEYFPVAELKKDRTWTTQPSSLWRGPEDDNELIKKMLGANNLENLFGGRKQCTFSDLWNANEDAIARTYPAVGSHECSYDRSSADAALCLQLAWWTGGDCERIERLFNQSALVRDKWRNRAQYRFNTITNAVNHCVGCLGADQGKREAAAITWQPPEPTQGQLRKIQLLSGPRIVPFAERETFFDNHYFIRSTNHVLCPDGVQRNQTDYNSCYGNFEFIEQFGGNKPLRDPWKAYILAPDVQRLEADDTIYAPEHEFLEVVEREGLEYVNIYRNTDVTAVEGDVTPFLNHINKLYPHGNHGVVLISYMAAFLQYPGVKFHWAPLLQGAEGCGKSLIGRILALCIGQSHVYKINAEEFIKGAQFNAWAAENRLGIIEEINVGDRIQADTTLKRYIDENRLEIQAKGRDQKTKPFNMNFILSSNFKDSLPINESSRRYCPLFAAQQSHADLIAAGMNNQYYGELFAWINGPGVGHIAHYLLNYKIPYEYDPTKGAHRAPETESFTEAVRESMPYIELAIREAISSGEPGTRGDWVSVGQIRKLVEADGVRIRSVQQITKLLQRMNYRIPPALEANRGRTSQPIMREDCKRAKLLVPPGHAALDPGLTPRTIYEMYTHAQGYTNET